jgi:crotonobetainyl-CoA:carnitine CoA-transferase CaiB-like acyl-CoA transferase
LLSGVKVIDFGMFVAGPYSSVILRDLGADVIKVDPITGDPNRSIFRSWGAANRGKRCISLDLKNPEGLKIARALCAGADVVTNNFRPGVSARLGIDAQTLHALKPDLVILESGAYGDTGPRAQGAGFDMCFQALCGHDLRAGGVGNAPLWNRTSMVDFASGLLGAAALLQYLFVRAREGAGAALGTSLLNTGLYLLSELLQRADGRFEGAQPLNHQQTGYHPAEQIYQAADGWIAVAARDEAMAVRLIEALGLSATVRKPRENWDAEVGAVIARTIRERSMAELARAFATADVWAEVCCRDGEESLRDEELVRLGTVYESTHPQFGKVRQIGPLVRLAGSRPVPHGHAPLPGEHTDAILAEVGYGAAEIADLRARKVVA